MVEEDGSTNANKRRFSKLDNSLVPGNAVSDMEESDSGNHEDQKGTPSNKREAGEIELTHESSTPAEELSELKRIQIINELKLTEDKHDSNTTHFISAEWWQQFVDTSRTDPMPPVKIPAGYSMQNESLSQAEYDLLVGWYGVNEPITVKFTIVGGFMHRISDQTVEESTLLADIIPDDPEIDIYIGSTTRAILAPHVFNRLNARKVEKTSTVGEANIGTSERVILVSTAVIPAGTTGLNNLGNTCYMNSSIQCLVHIEELVKYFLTGDYEKDININNPIGHGGQVAQSFGELIKSLYCDNSSSVAPHSFKSTIGRFNRAFAGYMQQDSQEFTAFLLDALHEDVNKVLEKPVTEKPELPDDKVNDENAIRDLAVAAWEQHSKRNDSVIRDLFTGLYKSTLVCPVCSKVSVTFDPFGDLTLPLPSANVWMHPLIYVPLNGDISTFELALHPQATMRQLKEQVSDVVNNDTANFLVGETFSGRLFAIYEDSDIVSDRIQPGEATIVLETRRENDETFPIVTYSRASGWFGIPFVTLANKSENTERLKERILERYQYFVTESDDLRFKLMKYPGKDSDTVLEPYIDFSKLKYLDPKDVEEAEDAMDVETEEFKVESEQKAHGNDIDDDGAGSSASSEISALSGPISSPSRIYTDQERKSHTYAPPTVVESPKPEPLLSPFDILVVEFDRVDQPVFKPHAEVENPVATKARIQKEEKQSVTLDDCLDLFAAPEVLGESDLWYCSKCKEFRQATKKMDLWQIGDILTIHLKRFSDFQSLRDKISDVVDFPIEGLDMSTRIQGPRSKDLIYDLIAVDNHYGGLGGGHYTSYAKNPIDKKWYYYDDSTVTPTEPEKSVSGAAYLLFYRRRSDQPLGNIPTGELSDIIKNAREKAELAAESKRAASPVEKTGDGNVASQSTSSLSTDRFPGSGNRLGGSEIETPLEEAPWAMIPSGSDSGSFSEVN